MIYVTYFTNLNVLAASIIPIALILVLFWFFRRSENPRSRSRSLGLMMSLSIIFWLFVGLSFVVCFALSEAYEYQPDVAVRTALGVTLLLSIFGGFPLSILLRRYSPRMALKNMKELSPPTPNAAATFAVACRKVGVTNAELRISKTVLPTSFVAESQRPTVVISDGLLTMLDRDEAEAVMAHELAHVKNGDTTLKALVTAYRAALPQDPIVRMIAAAFHRERELVADEIAVKAPRKPLSLASALLKIQQALPSNSRSHGTLSILGTGSILTNRHPSMRARITQLVRLSEMSLQRAAPN